MKGYICAILLLICGLILSAFPTRTEGFCLLGDRVYNVGVHTTRPCMRMICGTYGRISYQACPKVMRCPPGMKVIGYEPEKEGPSYPDCCPHLICKGFSKNS